MIGERLAKRISLQEGYVGQFAILWLVGALTYMGVGLVSPQFSVIITGQGFSVQQYGFIQALANLFSISSQVSIGKISDRLDKRKPLLAGALLLFVPMVALFPHSQSFVFFVLLLGFYQLAYSLFNATTANWVTRFGQEGQMGRLHGFYRISFTCGWVPATYLMGPALDRWGVTGTFYLGAGLIAAALVLALWGTKDAAGGQQKAAESSHGVGEVFIWPAQLKLILVALGIFTLAQTMGTNLKYIFFREEMLVTNQQFGVLASIQSAPEIPLMLILGIASDRFSNSALLLGGMFLAAVRWFSLTVVQTVPWLFAIQPLHAVGVTITEVIIVAVISRQVPKRFLGTVMGWQVTVVSLARLTAPILAGYMGELLGIRAVFFSSAVVSLLAGLLIFLASRRMQAESQIRRGSI